MVDKAWSYLHLATGYPSNDALLKQEFDKILSDPKRRENIRKAQQYLSAFAGTPKARAAKKRKKSSSTPTKKRKRTAAK
jgi:hypothetical protein